MNREISAKERRVGCIPAYAAYLFNRLHRGEDGKLAYERVTGEEACSSGGGVWRKGFVQGNLRNQSGKDKC
eukprot:11670071-Karenia_brevis.AAC.1